MSGFLLKKAKKPDKNFFCVRLEVAKSLYVLILVSVLQETSHLDRLIRLIRTMPDKPDKNHWPSEVKTLFPVNFDRDRSMNGEPRQGSPVQNHWPSIISGVNLSERTKTANFFVFWDKTKLGEATECHRLPPPPPNCWKTNCGIHNVPKIYSLRFYRQAQFRQAQN